jgi:hypothetical protein
VQLVSRQLDAHLTLVVAEQRVTVQQRRALTSALLDQERVDLADRDVDLGRSDGPTQERDGAGGEEGAYDHCRAELARQAHDLSDLSFGVPDDLPAHVWKPDATSLRVPVLVSGAGNSR